MWPHCEGYLAPGGTKSRNLARYLAVSTRRFNEVVEENDELKD
jgi:plasmid maintenance system antidote protein VapI